MVDDSREVSPWIKRELVGREPGVYLFKAQEAVGSALPFDASQINKDDRYAAAVYDVEGRIVKERRVLDKGRVLEIVQQHPSEYILLTRL